jgi:hypothetical protein
MKKTLCEADLKSLNVNGLQATEQEQDWIDERVKNEIRLVERFFDALVVKCHTSGYKKCEIGSYGLKHIIEDAFHTYISNSATIIGLFNCGIKQRFHKKLNHAPVNTFVTFYIKKETLGKYGNFVFRFDPSAPFRHPVEII